MKEKIWMLTSCFIIALIISLPVVSVKAYALSSIRVTEATGDEGYSIRDHAMNDVYVGILSSHDPLHIKAEGVLQNGNNVDVDQVGFSLNGANFYVADSCTGSLLGTDYNFECDKTWATPFLQPIQDCAVKLYDESGNFIVQSGFRVVVDTKPPTVTFNTDPERLTSSDISFDYDVTDSYANNPTNSYCVGIKSVVLTEDGAEIHSETRTEQPPICHLQGSFDYTTSSAGGAKYCINATDWFGQSTVTCKNLFVDHTPPEVTGIMIYNAESNEEARYLSDTKAVPLRIEVRFDSSDLDQNTVKMNLSTLGGPRTYQLGSCVIRGSETFCYWNFDAKIQSNLNPPRLPINFSDYAGNAVSEDLSANPLSLDKTGPAISSLETQYGVIGDGSYQAAAKTTFIVKLTDFVFDNNDIQLNLDDLLGGTHHPHPDNCTKEGSMSYTCYWYNVSIEAQNGDGKYIVATRETTDDLGNIASEEKVINITVDSTPPDVNSAQIDTIHAHPEIYGNRTVEGDFFRMSFLVKENGNALSAFTNMSEIGLNSYNPFSTYGGSCTDMINGVKNRTYFNCTMISPPINTSYGGVLTMRFFFSDEFGNRANITAPVYVYGTDKGGSNYWDLSVQCSPSSIDRKMAELTNMWTYCPITLTPKNSGADYVPLQINLVDCKEGEGNDYLYSSEIFNNYESLNPYLKLTYYDTYITPSHINYNCSLEILTEIRSHGLYIRGYENKTDYFYLYPASATDPDVDFVENDLGLKVVTTSNDYEKVNISFTIGFFNNSLATLGDEYKRKINDVLDDAKFGQSFLHKYEQFAAMANGICNVVKLFHAIATLVVFIEPMFEPLVHYHPTRPIATAYKHFTEATDTAQNGFYAAFSKFCGFMACDWTPLKWMGISSHWYKDMTDKTLQEVFKGNQFMEGFMHTVPTFPSNPKDSCLLSIASICIPGMIDCIHRWKQVQCIYGDCLVNNMQAGMPMDLCEDQYSYLNCKFVVGEFFSAVPFADALKNIGKAISQLLKSPITIILGAGVAACKFASESIPHSACHKAKFIMKQASAIISLIKSIAGNGNGMFKPGTDMCEQFLTDARNAGFEVEQ